MAEVTDELTATLNEERERVRQLSHVLQEEKRRSEKLQDDAAARSKSEARVAELDKAVRGNTSFYPGYLYFLLPSRLSRSLRKF